MFENLLKKLIRGFLKAVGYKSKDTESSEELPEATTGAKAKQKSANLSTANTTAYPMDYLSSSAIIFSGDFQSDVSTVNNDVRHYDNATFEDRFQEPKDGNIENGWWNPKGGAIFRFLNATVTRCLDKNGDDVNDSSLMGHTITNAGDRSGGKMVDLDPQMQSVSEIWGVRISIVAPDGSMCMEGKILHTGFRDLQYRQFTAQMQPDRNPNGQPLGASYCSVIEEVKWAENIGDFPILQQMKDATHQNKLRLHMNTYGYYYAHEDGRFSYGRVNGAITPWREDTPLKFAATRRVYGTIYGGPPSAVMAYTNFAVDPTQKRLKIDMGMSVPLDSPMGSVHSDYTSLTIAIAKDVQVNIAKNNKSNRYTIPGELFETIGTIDISDRENWLTNTGGLVSLPVSDDQIRLLENNQLLILKEENGQQVIYGRESVEGWYVRADQNVQRLDPGDSLHTDFFAYQWGRPAKGKNISVTLLPIQTGQGGGNPDAPDQPKADIPPINVPKGKVSITSPAATDSQGKTSVLLTGVDPGNPRKYIDGQIYLHSYAIDGVSGLDQYMLDMLIVHLRDAYSVPANPTWADVQDIWVQFGNLYPIMSHHIADFNVAGELLKRREILLLAFTRDINDPMYMPVTRDMSEAKLKTLVKWLENASEDEKGTFEAVAVSRPERKSMAGQEGFADRSSDDDINTLSRAKAGDQAVLEPTSEKSGQTVHYISITDH